MIEDENDGVIPEEDFRTAIDACCRNPRLERIYRCAPRGARMFVALRFYARVFAGEMDESRYRTCLSEIEPDLTPIDLDYLLLEETDEATRAYLQDLRDRLSSDADVAAAESPGRHVKLKRVEDVRREMKQEAGNDETAEAEEAGRRGDGMKWVIAAACAALLLFVVGGIGWQVFVWARARRAPAPQTESIFDERIRAVEMRIAETQEEDAALDARHAKELEKLSAEHAARIEKLKKQLDEQTALVETRSKKVEELVAESSRLALDVETVISKLKARIQARTGIDLAQAGRAGAVVDKACTKCKGAGQIADTRTCPTCGGDGRSIGVRYWDSTYSYYRIRRNGNCANCRGSGRVKVKIPCLQCDGKGRIPLDR